MRFRLLWPALQPKSRGIKLDAMSQANLHENSMFNILVLTINLAK